MRAEIQPPSSADRTPLRAVLWFVWQSPNLPKIYPEFTSPSSPCHSGWQHPRVPRGSSPARAPRGVLRGSPPARGACESAPSRVLTSPNRQNHAILCFDDETTRRHRVPRVTQSQRSFTVVSQSRTPPGSAARHVFRCLRLSRRNGVKSVFARRASWADPPGTFGPGRLPASVPSYLIARTGFRRRFACSELRSLALARNGQHNGCPEARTVENAPKIRAPPLQATAGAGAAARGREGRPPQSGEIGKFWGNASPLLLRPKEVA